MISARRALAVALLGAVFVSVSLTTSRPALAEDKECMTAASKGQEVRDKGQLVEARTQFQKCAQSTCPQPIPNYCRDWLAEVVKKMPTVVVRAVDENDRDATDATATIDDQPITLDGRAVDVDPGKHRVRIKRAGKQPFETEILVAQGEKDRVVVGKLLPETTTTTPPNPPETDPKKPEPVRGGIPTLSWVGWGIGAVGLLGFSIFGIKARLDYDSYESSCGTQCQVSDRDSVATSVLIADVSLVVGLIGAGVGTVFYLMRPTASATSAPPPSPSSARAASW